MSPKPNHKDDDVDVSSPASMFTLLDESISGFLKLPKTARNRFRHG